MAMSRSLLECGHDEDRDGEVCSYCASDGKLQPALYFCFDCGVYGKFICGKCLKDHNKYVNNHEVEKIGNQSTSRRTKNNDFKLRALQQSNDALQSENIKLNKDIKEIKKKNVKLSKELCDCRIDLDRATAELKIKTDECKRVSKRWNENRRLIVKDRDQLNARYRFMKKSNYTSILLVASIDFGTTGTSWAFGFPHDFSIEPTKIHVKNWSAGSLTSCKTSTSVLIHPDGKTFHSFGYEAEDHYAYLVEDNKHTKWFFFKHFNMNFDDRLGIVSNIMFEDVTGKQLEAKTVYALSVKYLKDDMIDCLKKLGCDVNEDSIHWVFTVPAISNDAAKQLMIDVIVEAGVKMELFTIVPEPVAISVLCRYIPVEKLCGLDTKSFASLQAGEKYMVLDIGGTTIQITVLESLSNGDLREIYAECDVGMGGTNVDKAYEAFLSEIFGAKVITKLKNKHPEDYIEMIRFFKMKKTSTDPTKSKQVVFPIPISLIEILNHNGRPLEECIALSRYEKQIVQNRDKMKIEIDIMKSFFDIPLESIFDNLKAVLAEVSGCSTILVVGGFSESRILQEHIRQNFPDKNIIIPQEASRAVLNGAVTFGHTIFQ